MLLDCAHMAETSRQPGELDPIYCRKCGQTRHTLPVGGRQWLVRCTECRYARRFGTARLTASTKATAHYFRTGHTLTLSTVDGDWHVMYRGDGQLALF